MLMNMHEPYMPEIRRTANRKKTGGGRLIAAALVLLLAAQAAVPTFASENITGPSGTGYRAEQWAALTDDVLEYDELENRIHEFNSSIKAGWETLSDTQQDLYGYVEDLESAQRKIRKLEEAAKNRLEQGDMGAAVEYGTYSAILDGYGPLPSFGSLIGTFRANAQAMMVAKSNTKQLKKGVEQILQGAQQLMIQYDMLQKQKKTMELMAAMYEEQYQAVLHKQAQGMATEQEVLTAQVNQLYAASLAANIDTYLMQMKPTLCTLTGWPADAGITVAEIPPTDLTAIDALNPEEDIRKAIGNNRTLISQRTSAKGKTTDGIRARLNQMTEGEEKVTIKMQSLYNDVLAKRTAYEAALAGWQAAVKDRGKYQRMLELGYLSRADFIGTELSYYSKEADFHSADTALRLALAVYEWAVKGYMSIE